MSRFQRRQSCGRTQTGGFQVALASAPIVQEQQGRAGMEPLYPRDQRTPLRLRQACVEEDGVGNGGPCRRPEGGASAMAGHVESFPTEDVFQHRPLRQVSNDEGNQRGVHDQTVP